MTMNKAKAEESDIGEVLSRSLMRKYRRIVILIEC
jgi:hypothetical protein